MAKIRYDKGLWECETLPTVQALGFSRQTLNHAVRATDITLEQLDKPKLKRARVGSKKSSNRKQAPTVQQEFRIVDLEGVRVTSKVFKGYGFYVVPGRDYEPGNGKDELQRKLYAGGGTLLANPGDLFEHLRAHYVIASSTRSRKVQNLVANGHQDIYAPAWVGHCLSKGRLVPPTPCMIIYSTPGTAEKLRQFVDSFGDSFVDPIEDTASLLQIFKVRFCGCSMPEIFSRCVSVVSPSWCSRPHHPIGDGSQPTIRATGASLHCRGASGLYSRGRRMHDLRIRRVHTLAVHLSVCWHSSRRFKMKSMDTNHSYCIA